MPEVSIVVPTYNEEELLPRLLDDLKKQKGVDYEVIVADALSEDRTREIAREAGGRVVDGGLPAEGRNAGAAVAKAPLLLFLDADVRMRRSFLKRTIEEFYARDLVAATCEIKALSPLSTDRVLHNFANLFMRLAQQSDPNAPGYCIFATKAVFDRVGGFDETLKVAEDHNFVKRAAEHGRFRLLDSAKILVDVRRFDKEGRTGYAIKNIRVSVYRALQGEIKNDNDFVEYEFGDYSEDDVSGSKKALRKLEKGILKLDKAATELDKKVFQNANDTDVRKRINDLMDQLRHGWDSVFGTGSDTGDSDASSTSTDKTRD
jgi:glycosyltransferase involved in cell wall biosynthesis